MDLISEYRYCTYNGHWWWVEEDSYTECSCLVPRTLKLHDRNGAWVVSKLGKCSISRVETYNSILFPVFIDFEILSARFLAEEEYTVL